MILVSVIVPVYGVEKYIERCLNSLVNQTYSNIEIIVVNDCSPDNSVKIVESFMERNTQICLVSHSKNMGLMRARQTGCNHSKGEYLVFCDADDTLPPNAIELLCNSMQPDMDIVMGKMAHIFVNGDIRYDDVEECTYNGESFSKKIINKQYRHNLCGKMFKRQILLGHDYVYYDNFINFEDGCLFYQMLRYVNKIGIIDHVVYNYFQNMESSTQVKLSLRGVETIIIGFSHVYSLVNKYPSLKKDASYMITDGLLRLYGIGYDYGHVNQCIVDSNLKKYLSLKYIVLNEGVYNSVRVLYHHSGTIWRLIRATK